jgi:hypothetical protein
MRYGVFTPHWKQSNPTPEEKDVEVAFILVGKRPDAVCDRAYRQGMKVRQPL